MLYYLQIALLAFSLFLPNLFITASFAQEVDSKKFYDKDYAIAPDYQKNSSLPSQSTSSSSVSKANEPVPQLKLGSTPQQAAEEQNIPSENYIEVIVNSLDINHLEKVTRTAIQLKKDRGILVRDIYHIGDYRNLSEKLKGELGGASISYVGIVKSPYPQTLTYSPSWILHTKNGYTIIEGASDISRFISASGEFQIPENKPKPTPTSSVKIQGL